MTWLALCLLACTGPDDRVKPDLSQADSATIDTAPSPGDSGVSSTDPCVPTTEILADGVDQACNGWSDELGLGLAAQDLALVEARGLANETFGEDADIGTVGGQPWALVSNGQGFYCESQAYRGIDWSNPEVVIDGGAGACNAKWTGSVADWPIAPFITNGHGGLLAAYGITVGVVDDDDPYTNIHLGSQDSEVHDIDLDGVDDPIGAASTSSSSPTAMATAPTRWCWAARATAMEAPSASPHSRDASRSTPASEPKARSARRTLIWCWSAEPQTTNSAFAYPQTRI